MPKSIPETFIMLTHDGLARVRFTIEQIQSIDHLLAKFSADKLIVGTNLAEHACGIQHAAIWTSGQSMAILELVRGTMVLNTYYTTVKPDGEGPTWVSPSFVKTDGSFPLRCAFDFQIWQEAGLRMFLGLQGGHVYLWVYYSGQIYKPPFGNVFENSCQLCLGDNSRAYSEIFHSGNLDSTRLSKALQLLSDSTWNHDAFQSNHLKYLQQLVRFNAEDTTLSMLPPSDASAITHCSVAANKNLSDITKGILKQVEVDI